MWVHRIPVKRPTLIVDQEKCLRSILWMHQKAETHGILFRPHFKTHQSVQVGQWFRNAGINAITVSSVSMARYFASDGWRDITIAFPVNLAEIDDINQLASEIQLNVLVENLHSVKFLGSRLKNRVGVFIEADTGHRRTGIEVEKKEDFLSVCKTISDYDIFCLKGIMAHNGQTYFHQDVRKILTVHDQSLRELVILKSYLRDEGFDVQLSIGDTPSMSITENFDGVDEIRPGNFVFFDLMQSQLGVCTPDQIAVVVVCPVVAVYPERNEVAIYGGAVHLSRDYILDSRDGKIYGKIVELTHSGWSEPLDKTYLKAIYQEHGIIKTSSDQIKKFSPGMLLGILPVHSCLTVNQFSEMYTLTGQRLTTIRSSGIC